MPFQFLHLTQWRRGCVLTGEVDTIPDGAMRRAVNVRTDRVAGAITSRPGWQRLTSAVVGGAVTWLGKLYGTTDYSYAQASSSIFRLSDTWQNASNILSSGPAKISSANLSDGNGNLYTYLVNDQVASKDDGTTTSTMGIAAPAAAPVAATLAADLSTTINACDDHTDWTGTDVTGKADEATIIQEGTGSVTFTVALSTLGSVAASLTNLDLDRIRDASNLPVGDAAVKDDDYIHVRVRVDRPDHLVYMQIDIDLDTAVVANAFVNNYFSIRLPSLTWFNQGRDQWNQIQVRKSAFARFGTDTDKGWQLTQAMRLSFLTNNLGSITPYIDDIKLRGGFDLEGEIEYTAVYRNSTTSARGNPPKNSAGAVLYTSKLTVNRQRVNVDISNLIEGGAAHPGDSQIDQIMLFRRGGTFATATLTETISDTASSPHLDEVTENSLLLLDAVTSLETDNDLPPTGSTRVLFGPDAQGVLFMIVDGVRIYFSKAFEDGENRAENWGTNNFFLAGDGAQRAIVGIATESERYFWTERATYQIVGIGINTFLPVEIPGSRGIVGQYAVTTGDGRIFFRASDGVYEQRGLQQIKLTGAIDPFFHGTEVDGEDPESTSAAARAEVRLAYHPDPAGSMVVMLYGSGGNVMPDKSLVLKPNPETGLHTEAFFDGSLLTQLQSLMVDDEDRTLLAGGADGHVYLIEDHQATTDAGTDIPIRARLKSLDGGLPAQDKHLAQALVEGNTGGAQLTTTAYYNRGEAFEVLGAASSTSPTTTMHFLPADATATWHDVMPELTATTSALITISRISLALAPLPVSTILFDTDDITFDDIQILKQLRLDIETQATVQITVYIEESVRDTRPLAHVVPRRVVDHDLVAGLKGRTFRLQLTSSAPFRVYRLSGLFKPLGTARGYQLVPLGDGHATAT